MATLKSIKNKYLSASDGAVLGVTTNTENISALSFKLATADSLTKFNLVDGFTDDYNDATGVNAAASTDASRNSSNYYVGLAGVTTSGWDSQITDGLYTVEAFTSAGSKTYVTDTEQSYDYLVVGGGGGGGGHGGAGGGGAGGVLSGTVTLAAGSYGITVGAGGPGGGGGYGGTITWSGLNSTFATGGPPGTVLAGGGAGGKSPGTAQIGSPYASGGGGDGVNGGSGWGPGGPNGPQGTNGGAGYFPGSANTGGGGGGSGGGAGDGSASAGGSGGSGTSNSITGSAVIYAGGGGGGSHAPSGTYPGGAGGSGGGGAGAPRGTGPGSDATGYGSGGGGAGGTGGSQSGDGGAGSGGVVYLKHLTAGAPGPMTLVSNAFTAQTPAPGPITARIILDEWAYTGTQTLNTDIKAYASRDNGTTFSQITLADQGYLVGAGGIQGNTVLMMHCDGSNNGTTFTDSSSEGGNTAHTCTANGNAVTSTAQYKFGTASGYFDGTGDYVAITGNLTDFQFGTDDLTIDFWMRPGLLSSQQRIFGDLNSGGSATAWAFTFRGDDVLQFDNGSGNNLILATSALSINTWYHIAVTRSGNDWSMYLNGVRTQNATNSQTLNAIQAASLSVGRHGDYAAQYYNGYVDEIRIQKGIAMWTGGTSFTPPVQEYKTSRRLLSGSVDISGQPSGTAVKYKIETLNQSSSKSTRVYATSMAWA